MGSEKNVKAAVFGGSGFVGAELIALLYGHPAVELVFVTAREQAGRRLAESYPQFQSISDLVFAPHSIIDQQGTFDEIDIVFFALPHGISQDYIPKVPNGVRVIDLGADYRIKDPERFNAYYQM